MPLPTAAPAAAAATSLPSALVMLLACAAGLSVANVYYAQPLLDAVAHEFAISQAAVGGVITATQIGCALALLLLVPLGDRVERRRLMMVQLAALIAALLCVAAAPTPALLLAGMLAVGLVGTAMTQGLIAYAAAAASDSERGRVVGTTQGGVLVGLLLARVMAGGVADLAGWRSVYLTSAAVMGSLALVLWRYLPAQPLSSEAPRYGQLLLSLLTLIARQRTLQVRGMLALLMFAVFNVFWTAIVLLLSTPPHNLSQTAIGALGLVGLVGALAAARAGHWADKGLGQRTTGYALLLLLASWLPLWLAPVSLGALLLGILLLDMAGQAIHVTNQSLIFATQPAAHSRLVSGYMLFYAVGSGLGAISSTSAYAAFGWDGVCVLGASLSLAGLWFWRAMRRLAAH